MFYYLSNLMQIKNLTDSEKNQTFYGTIKDNNKTFDGNTCYKTNITNALHQNDNNDFLLKNGNLIRKHGLHWIIAALFIIADMVGSGIVALPIAVVQSCKFFNDFFDEKTFDGFFDFFKFF